MDFSNIFLLVLLFIAIIITIFIYMIIIGANITKTEEERFIEDNDTDILVLKLILGHKTLSPTSIYTHISDKKLRDIMENCTLSSIIEKQGGF